MTKTDFKARFYSDDISCASCVMRVEKALKAVDHVRDVRVSLADRRIEVDFTAPLTALDIADHLAKAGYPLREATLDFRVEGMSCASCVGRVERVLKAQSGVKEAQVNLATQKARVQLLDGTVIFDQLADAVAKAGFQLVPEDTPAMDHAQKEYDGLRRELIFSAALTLPVFIMEMGGHLMPAFHHWLYGIVPLFWVWVVQFALASLVLFGTGRRFLQKGFPALWHGRPDMNSLVALGALAAWGYSTVVTFIPDLVPSAGRQVYYESVGVIIVLILTGRMLEARARGRAGRAIEKLLALQPQTALVHTPEGWAERAISAVQAGDLVMVRPGERIALDGVIETGQSIIDQSMLTGEPIGVSKGAGDGVTGGTLNGAGMIEVRITHIGKDTVLSRIIAMVETAQSGKLPVQALVDRITLWFVPVIIAIAKITFTIWLIWGPDLASAIMAAVSVLIIACPCAMGLATPVSIIVGTGRGADFGVLFREGAALQTLSHVQRAAFDKTGTLTKGQAELCDQLPQDPNLLRLAAAVERASEHSLAQAFLQAADRQSLALPDVQEFEVIVGHGVKAVVEGHSIALGAARMFDETDVAAWKNQADLWAGQGKTPVFMAVDGKIAALFALRDDPRPTAAPAVAALQHMGLEVAMISGDQTRVVQAIGAELGIKRLYGDVLPAGKVDVITALKPHVVFVGDGINDAPALAAADVGIAMGTGTDIAIEAAQVVLVTPNPMGVANAVHLSRAVMRNIRQNLFWAFGYNVVLIPVAAGVLVPFGGPQLSPMLAAGAMALSSVFVLTNALRLRFVRRLDDGKSA